MKEKSETPGYSKELGFFPMTMDVMECEGAEGSGQPLELSQ